MLNRLFEPFRIKSLSLNNRIVMSPMCQYKAVNGEGIPEDWHYIHLTSRAIGGTALVLTEMTNVSPNGRITEQCLGLYNEKQQDAFKRIIEGVHQYGSKIGIQVAHAGRKSTIPNGDIVGPSLVAFSDDSPTPRELTRDEISELVEAFARSTKLAVEAGFDTIELHGAHGYLIHQFMSKASNKRNDEYSDRTRFAKEVIQAVRSEMPSDMPLIFRVSATDMAEGGDTFDERLAVCRELIGYGIDIFDVSNGGDGPASPEVYDGYQVKFAEQYKREFGIPVISVGKLDNPRVADSVVRDGRADLICIGKGMLRHPYWAKEAAEELGQTLEMPGVYNVAY